MGKTAISTFLKGKCRRLVYSLRNKVLDYLKKKKSPLYSKVRKGSGRKGLYISLLQENMEKIK